MPPALLLPGTDRGDAVSATPLPPQAEEPREQGDNKTPRHTASQKSRLVYPNADTGSSAKAGNA